jgi:hypothetical protein
MIQTGFEKRVQVQQILANQLPDFIRAESPKTLDFLKQYYISQEHQSGATDLADNLDQYIKIDNLTQEVISGKTTLYSGISSTTDTVQVYSTKGFPDQYGLFKIDDEICTYTGLTTNTFTGVVRGFSGISSYRTDLNQEELLFEDTSQDEHEAGANVHNLSSNFLKEFYRKLKYTLTPGLEDLDFVSNLDVNNFIKESRSFYESKGTEESYKILFKVLYGEEPKIIDLEQYLPKPSSAEFLRREIVVAERISGDPDKLVGQTIKKASDLETQASVSEVEIFTRSGISTYFKLGLFVGFDDRDLIEGTFAIQPKVANINPVSIGSSVITVDSTVGFGTTGTLISGDNVITYSSKTVNQFLGCVGVDNAMGVNSPIRTNDVFFGYEDGDLTKKVEIRITGVLSDVETIGDVSSVTEGEKIYVKNVGEKIKNPQFNKTYKQIFANSWIYNTSSRFFVDNTNNGFNLKTTPDPSALKVGDIVDVLLGASETVVFADATVRTINGKQVALDGLSGSPSATTEYSIRRKLETVNSSGAPLVFGNDLITADIQNMYTEKENCFYVAASSLPSYTLTKSLDQAIITSLVSTNLQEFNTNKLKFSVLAFNSDVPFNTGEEVIYNAENNSLDGLEDGVSYFVKVLTDKKKIQLYRSRSLIDADNSTTPTREYFSAPSTSGFHKFTLVTQKTQFIHPQKLLRKFPYNLDVKTGENTITAPGALGMLVNGVEVINYKSEDKVYYGPLESVRVYNGGTNFDVVNLPSITIEAGLTTALVQPVVKGKLTEVYVDPQDFDVKKVSSVTITGGNSTGAVLSAQLEERHRTLSFDGRQSTVGGGVDVTNDNITFPQNHNLISGDELIYNRNGNNAIGVGIRTTAYQDGINLITGLTLNNGSVYVAEVVNNKTINLYETQADYSAGINTVGFTTAETSGTHKFRTKKANNTISKISIINAGTDFENRTLTVQPTGISTAHDTIFFKNHGFNDGEVITYSTDGTSIGGLDTNIRYKIIKLTDDEFRLANAGAAGTITTNYDRNNYVNIVSVGSSEQFFAYPPISITVNADIIGGVGVITATPVIKGSISDVYLNNVGTGYGSTTINFHKKPTITVKTGKGAELKPIINDGKIINVQVTNTGSEYTSPPDLEVVGIGSGTGAKLRAVVVNQKVTDVVVLNTGIGYTSATTSIKVTSRGSNASLEASVRHLTLNNHERHGNEILVDTEDGLQYGMVGYSTAIGLSEFGDDSIDHSPIIGWAYDGNPIYGPYGYDDPSNANSQVRNLSTSYNLSTSDVVDRPSGFSNGFFVDDYKFNNSGDLDKHNGRYGKTPEFPNGVYAYFVGINTNTQTSVFPHYIGNSYRSKLIEQVVDQTFDFNNSDLIRNTLPYAVGDSGSDNDFINEPNEILLQSSTIESVSKGSVQSFDIHEAGQGYKVGDLATFDNTGTNGGGISASVGSVTGKTVENLATTIEDYQNAKLIWKKSGEISVHTNSPHTLLDNDTVVISGISTFIAKLNGEHVIGVSSEKTKLILDTPAITATGIVTDVFVSTIPNISVGSTIGIGTARLSVLNIFPDRRVIRAITEHTAGIHTASTEVVEITDKFTIPLTTPYFESKLDDKVFFNPTQELGIGTVSGQSGISTIVIGNIPIPTSIPNQSIFIPNHPFTQNQQVTLTKGGTTRIVASNTGDSATFNIPESGETQTLFVINKSKNLIGLTTQVGLTTSTDGLFFRSFNSNSNDTDFKYSIESNFTQETARVEKIKSTISISTAHGLENGDVVTLTVKPKQSLGIGTSESILLKYNSAHDKILVNPISFGSTSVNLTKDEFELTSHGFETGEKVFYDSSNFITGLGTGSYFVHRIDDNKFNLSLTRKDSVSEPPLIIDLQSQGSLHEISKINPVIPVIKNNNLVFNTSDASLSGYNLKIFYDNQFNNQLVSIGSTLNFSVISAGSTTTVYYDDALPSKIYYSLEKAGFISTADTDVKNYSEITFEDSSYNDSYIISGVGATTFSISVSESPEQLSYVKTTADISYTTKSYAAEGGVGSLNLSFGGANYKKLPEFVSIASTDGINADIIPVSETVGRIKEFTINDQGFDFSADKTLNPEVYISPNITVVDRNEIVGIEILDGGKGYSSPPDLSLVNPETGTKYDTGVLKAKIQGAAISEIEILETPVGLNEVTNLVFAENNDNGIGINSCFTNTTGIVTCFLATPISGFTAAPFAVGDKVFVEGIINILNQGDGFNSADNKYNFYDVIGYTNSNPAKLVFDASQFVTTNPGIAVTAQNSFASVIKKTNYPVFKVTQSARAFIEGEKVFTKVGTDFVERDLIITENLNDTVKVFGTYELSVGDQIFGQNSGTLATIKLLKENKATFKVDYSLRKDTGWSNDTGKLNLDYQVLPDNDYYQNLSYTIKSSQTYDKLSSTVNGLVHPTGLKNFADTGITTVTKVSIGSSLESTSSATLDIVSENRVDTLNFFDLGIDVDTLPDDINPTKSKFIKFNNKKLSDFINCISNRVLSIDDISSQFSNAGGAESELFVDAHDYSLLDGYSRFLVQVIDPAGSERQATEIITLPSATGDIITFEKGSLDNRSDRQIANIEGDLTDNTLSLRFTPFEKFNTDYDLKIIKNKFTSSGIGSTSITIGFVDLISSNQIISAGSTNNLLYREAGKTESLFVNAEIFNGTTNERTYAEIFIDHDDTNTFTSEFYFDNDSNDSISDRFIGTFTSSISSGILTLDYINTDPNDVTVRTKIVGFGTTASGIGTHTFKASGQPDSSVNSARLQTNYVSIASTGTVFSVGKSDVTTVKAIAKVGYGNSSALHQFLIINDTTDSYITQYPFLPVGTGNTTGIGTFGSEFNGSNLDVKFFPDAGVSNVTVQTHSEIIQTTSDLVNIPDALSYGTIREEVITAGYNARNGNRVNKTDFDIKHEGVPIFQKTFDPTTALDVSTGIFNVPDHFFNTGEKLTYAAGSSFSGVTAASLQTGGSNIPTTVYAIKSGSDEFKLATSRNNALAGTAIGFSTFGSGNAHTLTMDKKLSKAIISIDGVAQSPIAFTKLSYTLQDNFGSVGAGETVFALSGIGTIAAGDLIKIDDEFIKVNLVGLGTTAVGPITGSGAFNLIDVTRGVVGSTAASHNDGATARVHLGSYNFVGSKIHFTEPPLGDNTRVFDPETLIPEARSTFGGRVYQRQDYTTNTVFDNISRDFTGIGATYTLSVGGANTTGIETGSGVLFLNDIFQTPTTTNNSGNIYDFVEGATGITSVTFTGITDANNDLIISNEDVNKNQLPRGGVIVSLGSTNGLGFAPLVGAAVTAVKNQDGVITAVGIGTADTHGSGYRGTVAIGVTDVAYEHRFESAGIGSIRKGSFAGPAYTATNAVYTSFSGEFVITIPGHNLNVNDTVGIDTGGIVFRCSKDHFATLHPYPRSGPTPTSTNGDPIVGIQTTITATTTNTITINVGAGGGAGTGAVVNATVGVGGTLTFTVANGGSGYVQPQINIPQPSYENLEVVGVSRLGVGATTETGKNLLITVDVGPTSTVGIGSTLREVKSFKIARQGYGFRKGDVFKPVGLVTDRGLGSVVQDFELTVLETFTDSFASWQFGELDNVDSIKNLQNGSRTRFPLEFNKELLSFETNNPEIDLNAVLLIFVNGVIQEPGQHYQFEGGTSFTFSEAPDEDDKVDIFFYRGSRGTDSVSVNTVETVKQGDILTLKKRDNDPNTLNQDPRTIYNITTSDKVETNLYTGLGISTVPRPISWTKQKVDKNIAGEAVSKARDSIEPLVYPTGRIISDLSTSGTEIFVDNGRLFDYEVGSPISIDALLVNTSGDPVAAAITATVSAAGTISALTIGAGGSGYTGSTVDVKISAPSAIGVGIGTTASATLSVVNGVLSGTANITNPGLGYTHSVPPQVITALPSVSLENITNAGVATGFSGIITGIQTATGIGGNPLALEFFVTHPSISALSANNRVLVSDTVTGFGITSIDGHNLSIVGVGNTFLDNIYKVDAFSRVNNAGILTCNILSTTSVVGIATTGSATNPCGTLSFGKISGFTRSSTPISIGVTGFTASTGLSTFPILQRRGTGLRDTGGLSK